MREGQHLRRLRPTSAFTLVELLVVILVIAVLIAVAVPAYLGHQAKAHDSATKQYLTVAYKAAKAAAASNEADHGSYPANVKSEISASEPQFSVVDGQVCADAASRANTELVYDTDSSSGATLVMYAESGSGKIFRLNGPAQGSPVIDHVCDGTVGAGGAEGSGGDDAPVTSSGSEPTLSTSGGDGNDPEVLVPINATNGTWTSPDGSDTTVTHQWQVCTDAAGTDCADVSGATSSSYTPVAADHTLYVRDKITACNDSGCTVYYTDTVGPVRPADPVLTGASPAISDQDGGVVTAVEGQALDASAGGWSSQTTPTYSYQWFRCTDNTSPASCTLISGATNSSYSPVASDVGQYLRVYVGATNSGGTTYAWSDTVGLVEAAGPTVSGTGPTVTGSGSQAPGTLTVDNGTWSTSASGITYSYQWQRSTNGSSGWTDISGATSQSYTTGSADVDRYVRALVTATNTSNGGNSTTTATSPVFVTAAAPALQSGGSPTLSGTAQPGSAISTSNGSWTTAAPSLNYSYQWFRCTSSSDTGTCSAISGATSASYTVQTADGGYFLRSRVTATNTDSASRSTSAYSPATAQIGGQPTVTTPSASLSGNTTVSFSASVNPNYLNVTSCYFEISNGGGTVACSPSPGSGGGAVTVSGSKSLSQNTQYQVRLVAQNAAGTSTSGWSNTVGTNRLCSNGVWYPYGSSCPSQSISVSVSVSAANSTQSWVSWSSSASFGSVSFCRAYINGGYYADTAPSGGPQLWNVQPGQVRFDCFGDAGGSGSGYG